MNPHQIIADAPLLGQLPKGAIKRLAEEASAVGLRGGEYLFREGDASDALYLVALGRLRVALVDDALVEIGAGDIVGEIGVLTGEARMADAVALRDTLLLRIDARAFRRVMSENDDAERELLRLVVQRLRGETRARRTSLTRSVAVMPLTEGVDVAAFARTLAQTLGSTLSGHVPLLSAESVDRDLGPGAAQTRFDAGSGNAELVAWLHDVEQDARHLVYCADGFPEPWTLRCARQADRILLVAGSGAELPDTMQALETAASLAPRELVLCDSSRGDTASLSGKCDAQLVHHCPQNNAAAMARLARQVSGRATGLVLGGGGARGFAHIGLLRALQEAELRIDMIGGTSMGALIAALHAQGASPGEIRNHCHATFVARNHLNDYVIPRVSLIRGRKFLRKLKEVLGECAIEDLPLPYYCVSTNLTLGRPEVHRSGDLATWVGASMCVPGIAPPVVYRGELLADGAVVNSVPVDTMHAMERGPVIACDVGAPGELSLEGVEGPAPEALLRRALKRRPTLSDILMRMTTMTSDLRLVENADLADLFLRMPVGDIGMFAFDEIDTIIERGYVHACAVLRDAADRWPGDGWPPPFHTPDGWPAGDRHEAD